MIMLIQVAGFLAWVPGIWLFLVKPRGSEAERDGALLLVVASGAFAIADALRRIWPSFGIQVAAFIFWLWFWWRRRKKGRARQWLGEKSRMLRDALVRRQREATVPVR
jgi:hypothetical protein